MSRYFIESSALIKRYKSENGSQAVNDLFESGNELFCLSLAVMEIRKVFYRLWKYPLQQDTQQGVQVNEEEFHNLESRFAADLSVVQRIEFTEEMVRRSTEIINRVWVPNIFDLAQLTVYMITKEEYNDIIFVCSDVRSGLINATKALYGDDQLLIPEQTT
jgi:predicted nucleic acid-binding protein